MTNKINKSLSTYVNRGRPETGEREIFRCRIVSSTFTGSSYADGRPEETIFPRL